MVAAVTQEGRQVNLAAYTVRVQIDRLGRTSVCILHDVCGGYCVYFRL